MIIVKDKPPNYEAIAAVFPLDKYPGAIFCFGDKVYNPSGRELTRALIAHEDVHRLQQGTNINMWWHAYLVDPAFRLAQEIPAHQEEYREFCETARDRVERRLYLSSISRRLASPLYGSVLTIDRARSLIKAKVKDDAS